MVEDKFSEALLDRTVESGSTALVDAEGDEIVIRKKEAEVKDPAMAEAEE